MELDNILAYINYSVYRNVKEKGGNTHIGFVLQDIQLFLWKQCDKTPPNSSQFYLYNANNNSNLEVLYAVR